LRLRRGSLNSTKPWEGFDFQFNPNLNRQQILNLATCEFIRQKRNVLICGPTGSENPFSASLSQEAARQGLDVLLVGVQKIAPAPARRSGGWLLGQTPCKPISAQTC